MAVIDARWGDMPLWQVSLNEAASRRAQEVGRAGLRAWLRDAEQSFLAALPREPLPPPRVARERPWGGDWPPYPMWITDLPLSSGVYRIWGPAGELLYIGQTSNLRRRTKQHWRNSPFAPAMAAVTWTVEAERLPAEAEAIRSERPLYNVVAPT